MYFECKNNSGDVLFSYDEFQNHARCKKCFFEGKSICQTNYFYEKQIDEKKYCFCFPRSKVKNNRQAKYFADIVIAAYRAANCMLSFGDAYQKSQKMAFHDSREIISAIKTKLLLAMNLSEENFMLATDKKGTIESQIRADIPNVARNILSIYKSTEQLIHEFTLLDYLHPNASVERADIDRVRLHTLYVMSFYMYEEEFHKRNIYFTPASSYEYIYTHFMLGKTIIAQLFDNMLKYVLEGSSINVHFLSSVIDGISYHGISFEMQSTPFEESEIPLLTTSGYRGKYVDKENTHGQGQGLYIINRLLELLHGRLCITTDGRITFDSKADCSYSTNTFIIYFRNKNPLLD